MTRRRTEGASVQNGQIPTPRPATRKYRRGGKVHVQKVRKPAVDYRSDGPNPIRQPKPALPMTYINLPHDPDQGAWAIISVMGAEYALALIDALVKRLNDPEEKEI